MKKRDEGTECALLLGRVHVNGAHRGDELCVALDIVDRTDLDQAALEVAAGLRLGQLVLGKLRGGQAGEEIVEDMVCVRSGAGFEAGRVGRSGAVAGRGAGREPKLSSGAWHGRLQIAWGGQGGPSFGRKGEFGARRVRSRAQLRSSGACVTVRDFSRR